MELSRDATRFLGDIAARPLSTTVSRYHRLHLSRRRGNAIRRDLLTAGLIEATPIATRSGQIVLYQLTDHGRSLCEQIGIDIGRRPRESLEHMFWITRTAEHFEKQGFELTREHAVPSGGAVDLLATRAGQRVAIEIETGKSDISANIAKVQDADFDRLILVATSPAAAETCQRVIEKSDRSSKLPVELLTWLDVS